MAQTKTTARTSRQRTSGAAASKRGARGKAAGGPILPSVANHPRGGPQVKRARSWAGLIGFVLVGVLSQRAHVPVPDTLLRALAGGIVAYLVVWACAVAIWRHLVLAELRVVRQQRAEQAAASAIDAPTPSAAEAPDA